MLFDGFTKKKFADRTVESFAVFKDGITPEWEDPENKRGGEWSIRQGASCVQSCSVVEGASFVVSGLKRRRHVRLCCCLYAEIGPEALDEYWDKLVLGAIGETIDTGDEITGVRVIHKVRRRTNEERGKGGVVVFVGVVTLQWC